MGHSRKGPQPPHFPLRVKRFHTRPEKYGIISRRGRKKEQVPGGGKKSRRNKANATTKATRDHRRPSSLLRMTSIRIRTARYMTRIEQGRRLTCQQVHTTWKPLWPSRVASHLRAPCAARHLLANDGRHFRYAVRLPGADVNALPLEPCPVRLSRVSSGHTASGQAASDSAPADTHVTHGWSHPKTRNHRNGARQLRGNAGSDDCREDCTTGKGGTVSALRAYIQPCLDEG